MIGGSTASADLFLDGDGATQKNPPSAILNLYDRRFVVDFREHSYLYKTLGPWDPATDHEVLDFLPNHDLEQFGSTYDPDSYISNEQWTVIEKEAFLHNRCLQFYNSETKAYDALQSLQGIDIPIIYAGVQLQTDASCTGSNTHFILIHGLLLESIDGFSLHDLEINASEESWQEICEEGIAIINKINNHNVINEDVRLDNVLVHQSRVSVGNEQRIVYKVILINFAMAWVRDCLKDRPTDEDWTIWKCGKDEEGALGCVIQG